MSKTRMLELQTAEKLTPRYSTKPDFTPMDKRLRFGPLGEIVERPIYKCVLTYFVSQEAKAAGRLSRHETRASSKKAAEYFASLLAIENIENAILAKTAKEGATPFTGRTFTMVDDDGEVIDYTVAELCCFAQKVALERFGF